MDRIKVTISGKRGIGKSQLAKAFSAFKSMPTSALLIIRRTSGVA
jgi:cytidylate kinase